MSSYVVGIGTINDLVSAVRLYAPTFPGVAERDSTEIGRTLLEENVATVVGRYLDDEEAEWLDEEERAENAAEKAQYEAMVADYTFQSVPALDAKQAIIAARSWQYQRTREGWDDFPGSWRLADAVVAGAIAALPADAFKDPHGPRTVENIANLYPGSAS